MGLKINMSGIKKAFGQTPEQLEAKQIKAEEEKKRKDELDEIYNKNLHEERKIVVAQTAKHDARVKKQDNFSLKGMLMGGVAANQEMLQNMGGFGNQIEMPTRQKKGRSTNESRNQDIGMPSMFPSVSDIIGAPTQHQVKTKKDKKDNGRQKTAIERVLYG